jgi:hypothetical protein
MSKRAKTRPAAKGRPKGTWSYARGKSHKDEEPEAMVLWIPDDTFCEEMSEWVDSPEGQLWMDMSDTLEVLLKDVGLDARHRKFLWPDANRLDLQQCVRRINQQYPSFPEDKIEEFLIDWIQELYVPEGYSEPQMDELERLTQHWAKDHSRQSTKRRTRHS